MENPSQAVRPASCTSLMDPSLYEAAMIGTASVLEHKKGQLDVLVSPNNNTVLHIAAQYGKLHCVQNILNMCPIIYDRWNSKGETPVHVAAREGHIDIVHALITHAHRVGAAKKMLMLANKDKDTALHEAVRFPHAGLVTLLTAEAPELSFIANNAEETPLYLAAERGYDDLVSGILTNCRSPDFGGPYGRTALLAAGGPYGRTALHASVFHNFEECTKQLLDWKQDLLKEADMYGWIPLHYAARSGFTSSVMQQLDKDKSVAYIMTDDDEEMTAIHIAATYGEVDVMNVLMSKLPGCWEMVNSRGQNILHIATKNRNVKVILFILYNSSLSCLINQKDDDGNTPLHLLAASNCFVPELIRHPIADKNPFNKENQTPLDMLSYGESSIEQDASKDILKEVGGITSWRRIFNMNKIEKKIRADQVPIEIRDDQVPIEIRADQVPIDQVPIEIRADQVPIEIRDDQVPIEIRADQVPIEIPDDQVPIEIRADQVPTDIRKAADTHLIVAALIATVTFAAGFTVPGGLDGNQGPNQGLAVLVRKAAFQTFVITDTVAMMLSTWAIVLYFGATNIEDKSRLESEYETAQCYTLAAMTAATIAFTTGMFAVLSHSRWLAIIECVIGAISVLMPYVKWTDLLRTFRSKNGCGKHF